MAVLYHAVNDAASTGAWLNSWATTLGDPQIRKIALRSVPPEEIGIAVSGDLDALVLLSLCTPELRGKRAVEIPNAVVESKDHSADVC